MRCKVITLQDNSYSKEVAKRCIESGKKYGIKVEEYPAITKELAPLILNNSRLRWTWAENNTREVICPYTGLKQFPYECKDLRTKIACSLSHYGLWQECHVSNEDYLILEHDAVFVRELPNIDFNGICQINNPRGCTPHGGWWAKQVKPGVNKKTIIPYADNRPDGLAGNSAYLIKPWAALELINTFHKYGVWPNDALICRQLFPYLEEYSPFIIETKQQMSTTV